MNWIETKIYTNTNGIDHVTGILLNIGINGFVIEDSADFENFLAGKETHWDYVEDNLMKLKDIETSITVYLAENAQGFEMLNQIKSEMNILKQQNNALGRLDVECLNVCEKDWENNWKQFFKPFYVGDTFVIKPSWESFEQKTDRIILEIDPSSSFGTGTHETTKLCIEALEKHMKKDDTVLDMGTGSGILSIASLLLGAKNIKAIDIDQNSVKIAEENLLKNNLENFDLYVGNVLDDQNLLNKIAGKYDIVVANIVADVIIAMRDILFENLSDNGTLITSGIILERYKEVEQALIDTGFNVVSMIEKNDWVCLVLNK